MVANSQKFSILIGPRSQKNVECKETEMLLLKITVIIHCLARLDTIVSVTEKESPRILWLFIYLEISFKTFAMT